MGWVNEDFQAVEVHGGKRIRPLLTLLTCKAASGYWHKATPAAAAVIGVCHRVHAHPAAANLSWVACAAAAYRTAGATVSCAVVTVFSCVACVVATEAR